MTSLSIILPVYNGEEFISITLRHLLDYQLSALEADSWEIIIIDDGSTDLTPQILSRFHHENIRIIRQANAGPARARNVGLKAATGQYVYFMDSDDLLSANALPILLNTAQNNDADIVKFCLRLISHQHYLQLINAIPPTEISAEEFILYSALDFLNLTQGMTTPTTDCTVLALYRREFLIYNSLTFNESLLIGEDVDLAWKSMFCHPRILYNPAQLYLYHQRDNSVSHNIKHIDKLVCGQEQYLYRILDIRKELYSLAPAESAAMSGINNTIRFYTNLVQANKIIAGASYREIFRSMLNIKRYGGDIHPGRPRFNGHITLTITRKAKFRRWISAYILALIAKLC